jgi:NADPH2:quinone reductase
MKANVIRLDKQGAPDVLHLKSMEIAAPGAGEVLLRQTVIGLNFMDVYQRGGQYPLPLPSGIGAEGAGVVEAVGANVSGLKAGDRVAYGGGAPGSYADLRLMPADRLLKLPDDISEEQAAAILMKGMTVEYMLQRCYPVKRGEFVLFHAAAGGVGLVAGQWGKALGATMIGVAGGPEKCALAKAHGYDHVIDRKREDIAARVREITNGAGVSVVYDSVGRDSFEASLKSLAPRGFFVSFGTTTGAPPPVEAATLQKMGSLYFTRPTLATYVARRDDLVMSANAVFDMVRKGAVKIHIGQRYRLADAAKAHADLEAGRTQGSSVMTP